MPEDTNKFADLVNALLTADEPPILPDEFKNNDKIKCIYIYLTGVRSILKSFSEGENIVNIELEGFTGQTLNKIHDYFNECRDVESALRKSEALYRKLARIDPLTGLYNRRHFEELASTEFERLYRSGGRCCIAMADIDRFKGFNDKYGHLVGDQCLIFVADIISKHIRKVDLCARYGGEEFIIMLPHTSISTGLLVCERVRASLESTPIMIADNPVTVTITIGVTEVLPEEMESDNIDFTLKKSIDEADKALYYAKNKQRNYVQQYKKKFN